MKFWAEIRWNDFVNADWEVICRISYLFSISQFDQDRKILHQNQCFCCLIGRVSIINVVITVSGVCVQGHANKRSKLWVHRHVCKCRRMRALCNRWCPQCLVYIRHDFKIFQIVILNNWSRGILDQDGHGVRPWVSLSLHSICVCPLKTYL